MKMENQHTRTSHFQRRAEERFGYRIHPHEIHPIVEAIKAGNVRFVRRIDFDLAIYEIDLFGRKAHVIFSWSTEVILTVQSSTKRRKQRNGLYRRMVEADGLQEV